MLARLRVCGFTRFFDLTRKRANSVTILHFRYHPLVRILYVSGGSAGHLAPLVAVERAIKQLDKEAAHLFLCSDRPEDSSYLRHEHVTFRAIPRPRRSLSMPLTFVRNYFASKKAIREFKPDVVFSKGGAVSVPACLAAKHLKIPIVIHESDAVMGRANALIAKWATKVCLGFPIQTRKPAGRQAGSQTRKRVNITVTGNPVRPEIIDGKRTEGLRITGLSGKRPIMMILGGSQGAEALNAAVRTNIDALLKICDIIHLTGKGKSGATKRAGYWSAEFAYGELPHLYAIATVALSRAGAGSISELAANGIPTILVPIRGLAHDHQMRNATTAQENGKCILLLQEYLPQQLVQTVAKLLSDTEQRTKISKTIRSLHHADASRLIAKIIAECVAKEAVRH